MNRAASCSWHTSASREDNFQNSICVVWSALVKSLEKAPSRKTTGNTRRKAAIYLEAVM